MYKLAIIATHPIQYYAPWFRYLAAKLDLKVFYLWDFGVTYQRDREFGQAFQWDLPLLEGYEHEFVPNVSTRPGSDRVWGLRNPELTRRVAASEPDAVLLMGYNYISYYRFLWEWRGAPLLFRGDSHCLVPRFGLKEVLKRAWLTAIYRRFRAVLYVGKANYDYFRHYGVPERRLFFSPHAVENDRFGVQAESAAIAARHWKRSLGIRDDFRVILFAGKFSAKKRPLDLLDAFRCARLPGVALLFVGAGELETELKERSRSVPNVYFAPFQNQTQMPRTYAAADLFVLPSYGERETWGLAVNEAMCISRAVLVSSHVGCGPDLVRPGYNGLIFPAGDIAALTDALQAAFSEPQRLQVWGQNSYQAIAHYSYCEATQGLLSALAFAIAESSRRQ